MSANLPSKLLKLPSKEADTWTPTGSHIVHLDMPAGIDFSNLDQAVVLLSVNIPNLEIVTNGQNAVRPCAIGIGRDAPEYDSDCFVRNCWMESEVAGRFDDMEEPNFLNQNLDFYSRSTEGRKAATSYNGSFLQDEYGFCRSTFRQVNKLSTRGQSLNLADDASSELTATLPIPLKKLVPFANNMAFYPNRLMGNTRLMLEFENDVKPLVYCWTDPTVYQCVGMAAAGAADPRNVLHLSQHFHNPNACSLYMNEPVRVLYTSYPGLGIGGIVEISYYTTPADVEGLLAGEYPIAPADITGGSAGSADFSCIITVSDQFSQVIVDMTVANPSVVTVASTKDLESGMEVTISGTIYSVAGTPVVESVKYKIIVLSPTTFSLYDLDGVTPVNVTAFVGGGLINYPTDGLQKLTVAITAAGNGYGESDVLTVSGIHFGGTAAYQLKIVVQELDPAPTNGHFDAYITALEHDETTDVISVTLSAPLPVSPNNHYGNISIQMMDKALIAEEPTWNITKVQLTVPQLFPGKQVMDSFMKNVKENGVVIPWFTWIREPQQMLEATKFDRQFTLPPNTGNVICLTATDSLVSVQDNASSFRFRINGQDATVYDIEPYSSYYYDGVVELWTNMGKTLNNLDESRNEDNDFAVPSMIYPLVVPLLPEPGFFSLRIHANAVMSQKNLYAYKQMQRTLKIGANEIAIE